MPSTFGSGNFGTGYFGGTTPVDLLQGVISWERDPSSDIFVVDRTGDRLQDLSAAVITETNWKLNDIGTASFTMPVDDYKNSAIVLGQTEIIIVENGEVWWGVVQRARTTSTTTEYQCDEITWYYSMRFVLTASLEYDTIDQLSIAVNISETAQTGTNRSFNIDTGSFSLSGKTRSRIYDRWQHPNMLEMLKEFPTLDDGFDFGVEYDLTGLREFWCYYPRKGSLKSNCACELGRNIVDYEIEEAADQLATLVYGTGGSNGSIKFEQPFSDDTKAAFYGTRYEAIVSDGDQKDIAWLYDFAVQTVNDRENPAIVPSITVKDDPTAVFGVAHVGDTIPVTIQRGRVNINGIYRILEITRDPKAKTTQLTIIEDS